MRRKTLIKMMIILLVVIIFIWYPNILVIAVPGIPEFPLGSLITAIGFISWSSFFRELGSWKKNQEKDLQYLVLNNISRLSLLLAWSWFFVSWAVTGNLGFNFTNSDRASELWWDFTYVVVMLPLFVFIADKVWSLVKQIRSHY